jgi:zinc/manganese transport system substrate-binding protein
MRRLRTVRTGVAGMLGTGMLLSGCATSPAPSRHGAVAAVYVVAAERSWGSIAEQLGGEMARVTSLVSNPAADPHDYEPTAADARAVATAQLVIVNGAGYDSWAAKLLAANPVDGRQVIDVGKLVGASASANPHLWYDPAIVDRVVAAVSAALRSADPASSDYFAGRAEHFESVDLARYHALIEAIKGDYAGTPVGVSESIFSMLAPALGLDVRTPASFQRAITEGTDPTARDKLAIDRQIADHKIAVYVYNTQNATPDVRAQVAAAKAAGIPVTAITETPVPQGASFQDWQVQQLEALQAALGEGARR